MYGEAVTIQQDICSCAGQVSHHVIVAQAQVISKPENCALHAVALQSDYCASHTSAASHTTRLVGMATQLFIAKFVGVTHPVPSLCVCCVDLSAVERQFRTADFGKKECWDLKGSVLNARAP